MVKHGGIWRTIKKRKETNLLRDKKIVCPHCNNFAYIIGVGECKKHKRITYGVRTTWSFFVKCPVCGAETDTYEYDDSAIETFLDGEFNRIRY